MKSVKCKIQDITDNTGFGYPHDMDSLIHKGFTVGKGNTLYWYICWHKTGNCTVHRNGSGLNTISRYLKGDTEITIHFK